MINLLLHNREYIKLIILLLIETKLTNIKIHNYLKFMQLDFLIFIWKILINILIENL